jgi:hypothetical protein
VIVAQDSRWRKASGGTAPIELDHVAPAVRIHIDRHEPPQWRIGW